MRVATTRFGKAYSTLINFLKSARYTLDLVYAYTLKFVSTMINLSLSLFASGYSSSYASEDVFCPVDVTRNYYSIVVTKNLINLSVSFDIYIRPILDRV